MITLVHQRAMISDMRLCTEMGQNPGDRPGAEKATIITLAVRTVATSIAMRRAIHLKLPISPLLAGACGCESRSICGGGPSDNDSIVLPVVSNTWGGLGVQPQTLLGNVGHLPL
jgi:hypothetical protein